MTGYKIIIIFDKETSRWEPAMCELEIPDDAKVVFPVLYEPSLGLREVLNSVKPFDGWSDYMHSPKKRTDRAIVKQILKIQILKIDCVTSQVPYMSAFDGIGYSAYEIANGLNLNLAGRVFFSPTATIYRTGEAVHAPLDVNIHEVCASGIHFFMGANEALDWLLNLDSFVMAVIDRLNYDCIGDPDLYKK